jgi:hypothetical protein
MEICIVMIYGYISRDWPSHIPRLHINPEWEAYKPILEQGVLNLLTAVNIQLVTPFRGGSVAWPPAQIIAALPKGSRADASLIELLLDLWERALKRYLENL